MDSSDHQTDFDGPQTDSSDEQQTQSSDGHLQREAEAWHLLQQELPKATFASLALCTAYEEAISLAKEACTEQIAFFAGCRQQLVQAKLQAEEELRLEAAEYHAQQLQEFASAEATCVQRIGEGYGVGQLLGDIERFAAAGQHTMELRLPKKDSEDLQAFVTEAADAFGVLVVLPGRLQETETGQPLLLLQSTAFTTAEPSAASLHKVQELLSTELAMELASIAIKKYIELNEEDQVTMLRILDVTPDAGGMLRGPVLAPTRRAQPAPLEPSPLRRYPSDESLRRLLGAAARHPGESSIMGQGCSAGPPAATQNPSSPASRALQELLGRPTPSSPIKPGGSCCSDARFGREASRAGAGSDEAALRACIQQQLQEACDSADAADPTLRQDFTLLSSAEPAAKWCIDRAPSYPFNYAALFPALARQETTATQAASGGVCGAGSYSAASPAPKGVQPALRQRGNDSLPVGRQEATATQAAAGGVRCAESYSATSPAPKGVQPALRQCGNDSLPLQGPLQQAERSTPRAAQPASSTTPTRPAAGGDRPEAPRFRFPLLSLESTGQPSKPYWPTPFWMGGPAGAAAVPHRHDAAEDAPPSPVASSCGETPAPGDVAEESPAAAPLQAAAASPAAASPAPVSAYRVAASPVQVHHRWQDHAAPPLAGPDVQDNPASVPMSVSPKPSDKRCKAAGMRSRGVTTLAPQKPISKPQSAKAARRAAHLCAELAPEELLACVPLSSKASLSSAAPVLVLSAAPKKKARQAERLRNLQEQQQGTKKKSRKLREAEKKQQRQRRMQHRQQQGGPASTSNEHQSSKPPVITGLKMVAGVAAGSGCCWDAAAAPSAPTSTAATGLTPKAGDTQPRGSKIQRKKDKKMQASGTQAAGAATAEAMAVLNSAPAGNQGGHGQQRRKVKATHRAGKQAGRALGGDSTGGLQQPGGGSRPAQAPAWLSSGAPVQPGNGSVGKGKGVGSTGGERRRMQLPRKNSGAVDVGIVRAAVGMRAYMARASDSSSGGSSVSEDGGGCCESLQLC